MPRPSPHLDVFLVPARLAELPDHDAIVAALAQAGIADGRAAGPRAARLLEGGYRSVRVDRPPNPTLYANRQGGFRVSCPTTGESVVRAFSAAIAAWREGGPAALSVCPSCEEGHDFDALVTRPLAAVGRGAIVLVDAGSTRLTAEGERVVGEILGDFRLVGSRR